MRVGFRRQEEVGEVGAQGLPLPIVAATAHIAIHSPCIAANWWKQRGAIETASSAQRWLPSS